MLYNFKNFLAVKESLHVSVKESHKIDIKDHFAQFKTRLEVKRELEEYLNEHGIEVVDAPNMHLKLANGMGIAFFSDYQNKTYVKFNLMSVYGSYVDKGTEDLDLIIKMIKSYDNGTVKESLEIQDDNYVGIHCSPKSLDNDDFYGKIIDEYYVTFKQVLELVQFDYTGAKELLKKIDSFEDGISLEDDSIDVVFEIVDFFAENNLEWIFVSKGEAMTKYGNNCYSVFFKDMSNVYSMQDELTDNATIYIYNTKTDKPILKNCEGCDVA